MLSSVHQLVLYLHNRLKHAAKDQPASLSENTAIDRSVCWLCASQHPSPFTMDDALPLCLPCFTIAYDAIMRPMLAGRGNAQRREYVKNLLHQAARLLDVDTTKGDVIDEPSRAGFVLSASFMNRRSSIGRTASVEDVSCWSCPRCTFFNPLAAAICEACSSPQPKRVECEHCHEQLNVCLLTSSKSLRRSAQVSPTCPVATLPHHPWTCAACTVMNAVDGECCYLCQTSRVWKCGACSAANRSRGATDGYRYCVVCGTLNATTAQPKDNARVGAVAASTVDYIASDQVSIREAEQQRKVVDSTKRLQVHLRALGVEKRVQIGDGNCLFRAIAHQLLNSPRHHMLVRFLTVDYVARHRGDYEPLFDGDDELNDYLAIMRQSGTWGDEVILNAAARCFNVHIHVFTSDEKRWHLIFSPRAIPDSGSQMSLSTVVDLDDDVVLVGADGSTEKPVDSPQRSREEDEVHIFLTYLNPTHYDDLDSPYPLEIDPSKALILALRKMESEESSWERVDLEQFLDDKTYGSWVSL